MTALAAFDDFALCTACSGNGCRDCAGEGSIPVRLWECPDCDHGRLGDDIWHSACDGTGLVEVRR